MQQLSYERSKQLSLASLVEKGKEFSVSEDLIILKNVY